MQPKKLFSRSSDPVPQFSECSYEMFDTERPEEKVKVKYACIEAGEVVFYSVAYHTECLP
jgi:hypothetical protein